MNELPYQRIMRDLMQDNRLSWAGKGLFLHLYYNCELAKTSYEDIARATANSDQLDDLLQELMDYMEIVYGESGDDFEYDGTKHAVCAVGTKARVYLTGTIRPAQRKAAGSSH